MADPAAHILAANHTGITRPYFSDVFLPAFGEAEARLPAVEKHYRVAGQSVRLRFFGDDVRVRLAPAFAHLERTDVADGTGVAPVAGTGEPGLTIALWDSASSGVTFPPPWSDPSYSFGIHSAVFPSAGDGFRGAWLGEREGMAFYDPSSKTAHFWTPNARQIPPWVPAAPLRPILHWFLSAQDVHLIHGAVVGAGGKAALLTAKSGSGKSTTSLTCLLEGLDFLGDDYVAVGSAEPVTAYSLYATAKVLPERMPDFADLREYAWDTQGEKTVLFLADARPDQLHASMPLAAILIPVITHAERTTVVPARKQDALLALLPTTLMQLPLAGTDKAGRLAHIIARTPCHFLRLGRDPREAARAVKAFLETV